MIIYTSPWTPSAHAFTGITLFGNGTPHGWKTTTHWKTKPKTVKTADAPAPLPLKILHGKDNDAPYLFKKQQHNYFPNCT